MGKEELDKIVIKESPEGSIKWTPEDYGFEAPSNQKNRQGADISKRGLWYFKSFELRSLANDYWLLRRRVRNDRGNSEMLVKWYLYIPLEDRELADIMLTKGLK